MPHELVGGRRLFHYTDSFGLLGILRTNLIWATDFRFLNDAQEAIYARELFVSAIADLANPALEETHPSHSGADSFGKVFDEYRSLVIDALGSPQTPVYVACFCESGDLLSQWRAYGRDQGYAIEVSSEVLQAITQDVTHHTSRPALAKVRYGQAAASDIVSSVVREINADSNLGHPGAHAYHMAIKLTGMLAEIKHPSFREENEWRLVAISEGGDADADGFRASTIAIVPYIAIPLPLDAIVSVRVGPGRHSELRQEGVRRLLHALHCDVPVACSEVPLRS